MLINKIVDTKSHSPLLVVGAFRRLWYIISFVYCSSFFGLNNQLQWLLLILHNTWKQMLYCYSPIKQTKKRKKIK
jgi:hypothetical protein